MSSESEFHQTFNVEGEILGYCGPIFFSRSAELLPTTVVANGGFGLVDTGKRHPLVTCCHVVDDFDKKRTENPNVQMAILLGGGYPVPLDRSLQHYDWSQEDLLDLPKNDPRKLQIAERLRRETTLSIKAPNTRTRTGQFKTHAPAIPTSLPTQANETAGRLRVHTNVHLYPPELRGSIWRG